MTPLVSSYIISIGGLGFVYMEYGPTCSAFVAFVYITYRLGSNPAIANHVAHAFDELLGHILPQFVQQYLSPPPKETSVSTFRDKRTGRRGFVVTERVGDDVKVTSIEEKRGQDGRYAHCARCDREDPGLWAHCAFCPRCGACYCSKKCRKADTSYHRRACLEA